MNTIELATGGVFGKGAMYYALWAYIVFSMRWTRKAFIVEIDPLFLGGAWGESETKITETIELMIQLTKLRPITGRSYIVLHAENYLLDLRRERRRCQLRVAQKKYLEKLKHHNPEPVDDEGWEPCQ